MARSLIDKIIYSITKKPKHYIEVRNPPETIRGKLARPQDARQVQYNKWSKAHQVFSGSYLPYQVRDLEHRGWETKRDSKNAYETEHFRKSTGQHVLRHGRHINKNGQLEPTHYHWKNLNAESLSKKEKKLNYYLDKYGSVCARKSEESHIKPFKARRNKK